jgi:hypothetical protein
MPDANVTRRATPALTGSLAIISSGAVSIALSVVPAHDRTGLFYAFIGVCGVVFVTTILLGLRAQKFRRALRAGVNPATAPNESRGARRPLAIIQGAAVIYAILAMCTIVAGISLRSVILAVIPSLVCIPILGALTYWATRGEREDEMGDPLTQADRPSTRAKMHTRGEPMETNGHGPRTWHVAGVIAGAAAGLGLGIYPEDDRSSLFYVVIGILLIVSASVLFSWAKHEERAGRGWWTSKSRSRGSDPDARL